MGRVEKYIFRCHECGYESSRWLGRCPDCGKWNTIVEEAIKEEKKYSPLSEKERSVPLPITKICAEENKSRYHTGILEFDRVLGGGIVPGSLILVGGEPGIGKSTLLLQIANSISKNHGRVLYISAEERYRREPAGIRPALSSAGMGNRHYILKADVNTAEPILTKKEKEGSCCQPRVN